MSNVTLNNTQMDKIDSVDVVSEAAKEIKKSKVDPAKVTAITRRVDNLIAANGSAEIAYGVRSLKLGMSWTESKVWINRLGREQARQHRRFAAA